MTNDTMDNNKIMETLKLAMEALAEKERRKIKMREINNRRYREDPEYKKRILETAKQWKLNKMATQQTA